MAKKPTVPVVRTRADMINALEANRQARRELEAKLAPFEAEYKVLKAELISNLLESKEEKASTTVATVSLSRVTVPVMDDVAVAMKWLIKTNNVHALQGQPFSTPAWRELVERNKGDLPGTHTFEKIDLNHSSIKT